MRIRKYGVVLDRLTEEDIELVRHHRNSDFIRQRMFYQKPISIEEQKQWFESVNNHLNYYFVISYKGTKVGLIHGTIISFEERVAKGGIFIWDKTALMGPVPIQASVCMADVTFQIMEMSKTLAEVREDNKTALTYNKKLGYIIDDRNEVEGKVLMSLTKEDYLEKGKSLRNLVKKISNDPEDLTLDSLSLPMGYDERLYANLPEYLSNKIKKINLNE